MSNRIEKEKGFLIALSVIALILGLSAVVGGIVIIANNVASLTSTDTEVTSASIVSLVFSIILLFCGALLGAFGVRYLWIGLSIKATKGSVAQDNLSKGTPNGKVCPKCGCTNTPDSTVCTSCGEKLD